ARLDEADQEGRDGQRDLRGGRGAARQVEAPQSYALPRPRHGPRQPRGAAADRIGAGALRRLRRQAAARERHGNLGRDDAAASQARLHQARGHGGGHRHRLRHLRRERARLERRRPGAPQLAAAATGVQRAGDTQGGSRMGRAGSLAVAMLVALTTAAPAQDYPNRLIKMMHGFPPGGNVDVIARLMADEMAKGLGQSIVVEAKPGLAGSLAAEVVARAEPDGYTLLLLPSAHAVTGAISKNLKYRPVEDFDWISTVSFYPFVLMVRKDSKLKTLRDLLDAARAAPAKVTFGSAGLGTIHQMTIEMLANATGVKFVHVPYRGEAPALRGRLSGDIDFIAI